ncbi:PulJ/GspJ family protein [Porticoccus sp.]
MTGQQVKSWGFTLVELQVALLLVSLIAVLMIGALRVSTQTWDKVTKKQDIAEHRLLIVNLLRKQLGNMRFFRVRTDDGELISSFMGNSESLHFVAPFPSFRNDGALYWWSLKTVWNDEVEHHQLVLDYRPYLASETVYFDEDGAPYYDDQAFREDRELKDVEISRLVVADDFLLSELTYYTRDSQGVEGWEEEWENSTQTPLVVQFVLTEVDADGNENDLPDIAVAPRFASQQLYAEELR